MKKGIRLGVIALLSAVAGCGYEHQPEVLRAMSDPMFGEWCARNHIKATRCESLNGSSTSIWFVYCPENLNEGK